MKTTLRSLGGPSAWVISILVNLAVCGAEGPYHFLKEIPVGGEGGWDYLSVDEAGRRLYVAHATKVVALDLDKDEVVTSVPIGDGVDANVFDPATQLAFSSNGGDGTVTIAHEDTPEKLTVVQTLATERGARTMALDPKTHRIYLGAVKYEAQPSQTPGTPRGRPRAVPNSFRILVYGQ